VILPFDPHGENAGEWRINALRSFGDRRTSTIEALARKPPELESNRRIE